MKDNIYHSLEEQIVDYIKFRVEEVTSEEITNKELHLPYQTLLKFFYDVRHLIQST